MRRVAVLGATGSVGLQALEVIDEHEGLVACGLAAGTSDEALVAAARARGVQAIALQDAAAAARARAAFDGPVLEGRDGVAALAAETGADLVLNAVVGVAGLDATLAALDAGVDVALANKESLVAGAPLVLAARDRNGATLLPVDSEHSALWQLVGGEPFETVTSLVITASGGPFRGRTRAELEHVGVEDALAHPTWRMGAKITIDSATLMNKGLELIEAHVLFGVPLQRIEVVVHPQSIVHALVRLRDGALLAHIGLPDMRVPISYALTYPERAATPAAALDLTRALALTFEPPDLDSFRCLALAREAGEAGGTAPAVLNAANEEAVAAFLDGRCRFLDIAPLVERALEAVPVEELLERPQVDEVDRRARDVVRSSL
jgi:1-deoxy-D-xylulose-5-phosphate reductoisomerase